MDTAIHFFQTAAQWLAVLLIPISWWMHSLSAKNKELADENEAQKQKIAALDKEVAVLQEWRRGHEESDSKAHDGLGDKIVDVGKKVDEGLDRVSTELGLVRAESSEQHKALETKMDAATADGTKARRELHQTVNDISVRLARMEGAKGEG